MELKLECLWEVKTGGMSGDTQHSAQGEEVLCKHGCLTSGRVKA